MFLFSSCMCSFIAFLIPFPSLWKQTILHFRLHVERSFTIYRQDILAACYWRQPHCYHTNFPYMEYVNYRNYNGLPCEREKKLALKLKQTICVMLTINYVLSSGNIDRWRATEVHPQLKQCNGNQFLCLEVIWSFLGNLGLVSKKIQLNGNFKVFSNLSHEESARPTPAPLPTMGEK